jgi:hypothetical protein
MVGQSGKWWRFGAVGGLLVGLVAAWLLWQASSEAGGAPLEPQVAAVVKGQQLQVAVALAKEPAQRLSGTLTVELVGPAGERVAEARQELRDAEPLTSLRFDLTPAPASTDKARLRVSFDGRQAEVPLAKVLLAKAHEMSLSVRPW